MRSSSARAVTIGVALLLLAGRARAQAPAAGLAVERFASSAPGAGWLVMDALDQRGFGGALSFTLGGSGTPLRVTDGVSRVAVVSAQAFAEVGAALEWRRWRFHLQLVSPLAVVGDSGVVAGWTFTAPAVDPGTNPDLLADARLGVDVRVLGAPNGRFRLGAGAQLFVPFGNRSDYVTDGTVRGAVRVLAAGDVRWFTWAAELGVHIRAIDEPTPGSPKGSELLFGVAGGARLPVGRAGAWVVIVGPELFGASAFHSFLSGNTTALEALASARLEGTRERRANLRVKLGVGGALNHHFGAPEWRVVAGVELFGRR
jgi:hypothetical protein